MVLSEETFALPPNNSNNLFVPFFSSKWRYFRKIPTRALAPHATRLSPLNSFFSSSDPRSNESAQRVPTEDGKATHVDDEVRDAKKKKNDLRAG